MFRRRQRDEDQWDTPDQEWADDGWLDDDESVRRRRWPGCFLSVTALLLFVAAVYLLVGRDRPAGLAASATLVTGVADDVRDPTLVPLAAAPTAPATAPFVPTPVGPTPGEYDPAALAAHALRLINVDRAAYGLAPVAWDETAAQAGERHAADMLAHGYFAHWNTAGLGPDHRYALLGGEHAVMENLHALTYAFADGGGAPIEDWAAVIEQAQSGFMLSPGHRANILDPAHTHVGVGLAYDPASGEFRLAQEFTNQYVTLTTSLPSEATAGQTIRVAGHFTDGLLNNIILSLAFEPWPEPMTPDELARTDVYMSVAESVDARQVARQFDEQLTLGEPGLYHVRLFADVAGGQVLVMDRIIAVR